MDRLAFYQALYFAELQRKEELRKAATLPTGVLTVLGGVIALYLRELGRGGVADTAGALLSVFTVFLVCSFIAALVCLTRSYHEYTYDFVPYATDLEEAYQELRAYHENVQTANADFEASLIQGLATAHRKNAFNNDAKSSHLHNANRALAYAIACALLCAIPYFWRTTQQDRTVTDEVSIALFYPDKHVFATQTWR